MDSPAAEVALDEDLVRELLRVQAPDLAEQPLRLVAEGWDNAMWRLGEQWTVRLPRRSAAAELIRHEQEHLASIDRRLASVGVRTPAPIRCGRPQGSFPWVWSVVPWITGHDALTQPRGSRSAWAQHLGRALRALHAPAVEPFPRNPVRGVPLVVRDAVLRAVAEELMRTDADTAVALRDVWSSGVAAPQHDGPPLWLHGDLHPGNIVVHRGSLVALIDFGDVTAGDPAYDLAAAWTVFDGAGRAAFRSALHGAYDGAAWIRARSWAAGLALILLTRSDDRPDFAALGAEIAAQVLAEGPPSR